MGANGGVAFSIWYGDWSTTPFPQVTCVWKIAGETRFRELRNAASVSPGPTPNLAVGAESNFAEMLWAVEEQRALRSGKRFSSALRRSGNFRAQRVQFGGAEAELSGDVRREYADERCACDDSLSASVRFATGFSRA